MNNSTYRLNRAFGLTERFEDGTEYPFMRLQIAFKNERGSLPVPARAELVPVW